MDINLEDMTVKAKEKLLKKILEGILSRLSWSGDDEEDKNSTLDYILVDLLNMLDENDQDDFWGTEGWQHTFGVES